MKKHIIYLMLAICIVGSMSFAFGQKAETKTTPVSSLSPEMEQQVKVEYDSLMAIYDPWKAIQKIGSQEENLKKANASKADIFEALKELDRKYPHAKIGDAILFSTIMLNLHFKPQKDTIDGPLPAKHNPKYDEHYRETLGYALRLADEYPQSAFAEKMLLHVGGQYAGFLDERDGKYIKPYVELVKRYPKSRFIMIALFMISESAEFETEGFAPDFDTRMWAYSLWRKKYDDHYFYLNFFDDPKIETLYNDKRNWKKLKEEIDREKQEVGKRLLNIVATSIGHAMETYWDRNKAFPMITTNNGNEIYYFLLPYYWENDILLRFNPFVKYKDLKLLKFKSEAKKYEMKLKLFDVEIDDYCDRTVPRGR